MSNLDGRLGQWLSFADGSAARGYRKAVITRPSVGASSSRRGLPASCFRGYLVFEGRRNLMKILVTGFDPFEDEPINPSWEAVRRLPDTVEHAEIIKVQIPTSFGRSADVVVSVGQAGGQSVISPERVAINVDDGRIPDNDGNQPIDTPIRSDGPAA